MLETSAWFNRTLRFADIGFAGYYLTLTHQNLSACAHFLCLGAGINGLIYLRATNPVKVVRNTNSLMQEHRNIFIKQTPLL